MRSLDKHMTSNSFFSHVEDQDIELMPDYIPQFSSEEIALNGREQERISDSSTLSIKLNAKGFEEENPQSYGPGELFTSTQGLQIYSNNGGFDIVDFNWFGYKANVLLLTENKSFKINVAESGFKEFSFDYFGLHNSTTKVCFYDGEGNLIAAVPLEYTGSTNKENFIIKTLNFNAPAGKTIGQVVIDVGDEPSVGDAGFIVDNLSWSGAAPLEVTALLQMMGKDSGSSVSDLITNDGTAGRTVSGTLSRPLSDNEHLEFWNGSEWVQANVSLQRWTVVDDSAHTSSWQYKLRVVHVENGPGSEFNFDITLDTTPSMVKVVFEAMTADDGSSASDWQTSDGKAGRKVSGSVDRALENGDVVQYSLNGGKTWLNLDVQSDLSWSFTDTTARSNDWSYLVRIIDNAGNIAEPTRQDIVFVMRVPEISTIHDNVNATGFLTSPGFTDDQTPTLKGSAQPGTTLSIYNGTEWMGACSVDAAGNWQWTSPTALPSGEYHFQVVASSGDKSSAPSSSWLVTIVAAPQITSIYDDTGPLQGVISNGGYTDDNTPTLHGKAVAGSLVTVYADNQVIGSVVASSAGEWMWSVAENYPDGLAVGIHAFSVKTPIGDGSSTTSPGWLVKIVAPTPHAIGNINSMSLDSGIYADDFITNDGSSGRTVTGTLSRALIGTEKLEFWDGSSWQQATVNGKTWNAIDTTAHSESWQYKVRVAVGDGNYGPESNRDVVLDKIAAIPLITHAWDAVGDTGEVLSGGITDDNRPVIKGMTEPGLLVQIQFGRSHLPWQPGGSAVADSNGNWEWYPPLDLPDAIWEVRARVTDTAGNLSGWSKKFTFIVDTTTELHEVADGSHAISGLQSELFWHEGASLLQEEYVLNQLTLMGEEQHIELNTLSFLKSVNTIDITGQGDNQLTLTADDILQKGDEYLFISYDTTQILINGDAGDVVNLKSLIDEDELDSWSQSVGTVISGGKGYNVWTNDSADIELLIQTDIQVNI